jgi:hypothetical protein
MRRVSRAVRRSAVPPEIPLLLLLLLLLPRVMRA